MVEKQQELQKEKEQQAEILKQMSVFMQGMMVNHQM